jgi:peptide/nickel transport system ATP-binding protein/oligopeptide transport system ATP-binding protein
MSALLELSGVHRHFEIRQGFRKTSTLRAVEDVSLSITRGQSLGLVGESGCGKSTVARMVARLLDPTAGRILLEDQPLADAPRERVQIVFQDPHASLNPRRSIFQAVAEPLVIHRNLRGGALNARVGELLETVGLPGRFMYRYPHELSGGQKQRVAIARAVALEPSLLVLDEPTSALDVSVQAQILEFLKDLRERLGLSYLFISHNLSVIRMMSDEVAVMYLGRVVEQGETAAVFSSPRHPYTRALIDAVPLPLADQPAHRLLPGDVPSPIHRPSGCAFHERCPFAEAQLCDKVEPELLPLKEHWVACHRPLAP